MATKVLVVDDILEIRLLVERFLSAAGYQVLQGEGGEHALELISRGDIDLMITDIRMPGMTGVELCTKALEIHPELMVIGMTGEAPPNDIQDLLNTGALLCLRKPFTNQGLMDKVGEVDLIRQRRQVRNSAEMPREAPDSTLLEQGRTKQKVLVLIIVLVAIAVAIALGKNKFTEDPDKGRDTSVDQDSPIGP